MIKKMSTKYYSDAISNPTLQKYYAELEALALERTEVNEIVDHTQPDVEEMQKHAGKEISKFIDLISQADGDKCFASPSKKAATSLDLKELQDHVKSGTLAKLTVPTLKQCAIMRNVKSASNRKAALLAAIIDFFDA
ncbi:unnamed protein product [Rodentolepis nana]|uniref:Ku_C domain-containing protein n=1 Tax=Rodentolepis nana TaxID=102285 RepID=A0A0R3TJ14_RODNA|nr:unnamed protein product [Rodentolepis nana]